MMETNADITTTAKFPSGGGVAQRAGVVYPGSRDTINYFALPYNKNLVPRARELRKGGSLPEALFWREIKCKKINGLDFDRQKVIGNYIVDFYCASNRLVIEIDDTTHDNKVQYDEIRNKYLTDLGLYVIHFSAKDVLKDMDSVIRYLVNHPAALPHPDNGGELANHRRKI